MNTLRASNRNIVFIGMIVIMALGLSGCKTRALKPEGPYGRLNIYSNDDNTDLILNICALNIPDTNYPIQYRFTGYDINDKWEKNSNLTDWRNFAPDLDWHNFDRAGWCQGIMDVENWYNEGVDYCPFSTVTIQIDYQGVIYETKQECTYVFYPGEKKLINDIEFRVIEYKTLK